MILVKPVILCGGSGSRLWPLSRAGFPKQFLSLTGKETLFQQSASRLMNANGHLFDFADPDIVCNEEHRFLALEQLREIHMPFGKMILESEGRNTAPALTLAALSAVDDGGDPILIVSPSDQAILDSDRFCSVIQQAILAANTGGIVTLGITPLEPKTGYGYIHLLNKDQPDPFDSFAVKQFVEKPDAATAQTYLDDGGYYWNSGIFVLKASVWLEAIALFRADILQSTQKAWAGHIVDGSFVRPDATAYTVVAAESIDFAVMEHCPASHIPVRMLALDAGWSDLGAWNEVWNALDKDTSGNVCVGDVIAVNAQNSLVHANSRMVSIVEIDDVVVVETADSVMVTRRENSQMVKSIVHEIEKQGRPEHNLHRKVYRPWGWYDSIDNDMGFKVKRISVNPGASLSLQKHEHRSKHWVVVRGTAEVTCDDDVFVLQQNQSTYIPSGTVHRLSNPSKQPLEIIEVQSGDYLEEDDIIRLEDIYGRK